MPSASSKLLTYVHRWRSFSCSMSLFRSCVTAESLDPKLWCSGKSCCVFPIFAFLRVISSSAWAAKVTDPVPKGHPITCTLISLIIDFLLSSQSFATLLYPWSNVTSLPSDWSIIFLRSTLFLGRRVRESDDILRINAWTSESPIMLAKDFLSFRWYGS